MELLIHLLLKISLMLVLRTDYHWPYENYGGYYIGGHASYIPGSACGLFSVDDWHNDSTIGDIQGSPN